MPGAQQAGAAHGAGHGAAQGAGAGAHGAQGAGAAQAGRSTPGPSSSSHTGSSFGSAACGGTCTCSSFSQPQDEPQEVQAGAAQGAGAGAAQGAGQAGAQQAGAAQHGSGQQDFGRQLRAASAVRAVPSTATIVATQITNMRFIENPPTYRYRSVQGFVLTPSNVLSRSPSLTALEGSRTNLAVPRRTRPHADRPVEPQRPSCVVLNSQLMTIS